MLLFLLNNWKLVALAVTIAFLSATAGFYKWRANVWETRYEIFRTETLAAGIAAEAKAKETEARDKKAKEVADARVKKTIDSLRADNLRLRDEHARSGFLPAAPAGSRGAATACFTRPDLERALRDFEIGLEGIVAEGDEARAGLNAAREWAQRP